MSKFSIAGPLLDACVLGVLSVKPTYGYDLTQTIQQQTDLSESTLYPVLRRLLKNQLLETFDQEVDGRNRRYYKITPAGVSVLERYRQEWGLYQMRICRLLSGGMAS